METIEVLNIKSKNAYLITKCKIDSYRKYSINGVEIKNELKSSQIILLHTDILEFTSNSDELIHYQRGDEIMSVEDYRSKPTSFDSDDCDEHTLRCIANKKELEGFNAIYEPAKPVPVKVNIVGDIEDTGSKFIHTTIKGKWSKHPVLYTTYGSTIALDEYNNLSIEYKDSGKFSENDRSDLEYTKINSRFVFGNCYPFGSFSYEKNFTNLKQAIEEEEEVRSFVKKVVFRCLFPDAPSELTLNKIMAQLMLIKKIPTVKAKNDGLGIMIKDINNHIGKIK